MKMRVSVRVDALDQGVMLSLIQLHRCFISGKPPAKADS